jgi:2-polyprenyl-6-hydroxyphenyl methylase/3-demethylubiquinone-9 3-methyltransferase
MASQAQRVDPAEIGKFDALAHEFWDPRGSFKPLHVLNPVRVDYVHSRAALAGRRVLDVGCGGGLLAESLWRLGAQVTAVDLAPGMIEVAQLHAIESGAVVDYRHCAAEDLPTTDAGGSADAGSSGGFDVVTCMEMLEHVPDPAATMGTLARLVRPGGDLVISTLNRNLRSFLLGIVAAEYVLKLIPRGTHEYARLIRPAELARIGRSHGLTLRDISGIEFNPFAGSARLARDPSVNYLAHLTRPPE